MGEFVITMPAVSYARELWRYGEQDLARRAAVMSPAECADVGVRAGELSATGEASRLWPGGPRGHTTAVLLAVVEHLEGCARPCARTRRAAESSLPAQWQLTEDQRWAALEPVVRAMEARRHG